MNHYLLWPPMLVLYCVLSGWASTRPTSAGAFAVYWLCGQFGVLLWWYVSRVTSNIVFDSMLYDIILCPCFVIGLWMFTADKQSFSLLNATGGVLALCGLLLMKVK